jgi:hypothetical protein
VRVDSHPHPHIRHDHARLQVKSGYRQPMLWRASLSWIMTLFFLWMVSLLPHPYATALIYIVLYTYMSHPEFNSARRNSSPNPTHTSPPHLEPTSLRQHDQRQQGWSQRLDNT